eukprot:10977135-Karenia_brevis.AAC.1
MFVPSAPLNMRCLQREWTAKVVWSGCENHCQERSFESSQLCQNRILQVPKWMYTSADIPSTAPPPQRRVVCLHCRSIPSCHEHSVQTVELCHPAQSRSEPLPHGTTVAGRQGVGSKLT